MTAFNFRKTAAPLALTATMALGAFVGTALPAAAHGDEARLAPARQNQLADARRATARCRDVASAARSEDKGADARTADRRHDATSGFPAHRSTRVSAVIDPTTAG